MEKTNIVACNNELLNTLIRMIRYSIQRKIMVVAPFVSKGAIAWRLLCYSTAVSKQIDLNVG